jgi:hypothetical protein
MQNVDVSAILKHRKDLFSDSVFVEIINFNQICPNLIGIIYRIMGSVVLLCVVVFEDFIKELNVRLVAIDHPVLAKAINIC